MADRTRLTGTGATGGSAPNTTASLTRTLAAGGAGGLAFVLGTFLTFGLFGGSRSGHQGLLFDPDTQHPKVITVWKVLEPLPRITETPAVILAGLLGFGIGYAFLYRSIGAGWPGGPHRRALRLALIGWLAAAFSEFMGPFNVLHEPVPLVALSLGFWSVPALSQAYVIVFIADRR